MKRISAISISLFACISLHAGTSPLFFNPGSITSAIPIDATSFFNLGTFDLSTPTPYDTQNTLNFTNRGTMLGSVGFRFDNTTENFRRPAANFVNSGNITASDFNFFFGSGFLNGGGLGFFNSSQGSFVLVAATNIDNRNGTIAVGQTGLVRLKGQNVNLSRSSITAGDPFTGNSSAGFLFGTNFYSNPSDVSDTYWGAGIQTNNVDTQIGKTPPNGVLSPFHLVASATSGTNQFNVSVPQNFNAKFKAFANKAQDGTNKLVQVVFLNTNFSLENIKASVTFSDRVRSQNPNVDTNPAKPVGRVAIVQFSAPSFDPVSGKIATNNVFFVDSLAQQTNSLLFTNFTATGARPSSYEIITSSNLVGNIGTNGNAVYAPSMLYDAASHQTNVVAGNYAGYSASIGPILSVPSGVNITNQAPRIEVQADTLDISLARIRSEGPVIITATNLIGQSPVAINAGLLSADLGSTSGSMVVSNIFPSNFQRLRGDLYAWSYTWQNTEVTGTETNLIKFHVLILDQSLAASLTPIVERLTLRSENLVIEDDLFVSNSVRIASENLTINSSLQLSGIPNLTLNNFVGVKNLTLGTNGLISVANNAFFGFDTENGYDSINNNGLILATAPQFKSGSFLNSGSIQANNGGSIIIQANDTVISNSVASAKVRASHDVYLTSQNLFVTNSVIAAGIDVFTITNTASNTVQEFTQDSLGQLVFDVSGSMSDGTTTIGSAIHNSWRVTDGFSLLSKPFSGDLYGTKIETVAPAASFAEIRHFWAGEDLGADGAGFLNNSVLGELDLTIRSDAALLRFSGTGSGNALYVNTLVITNPLAFSTNVLAKVIVIDPNFKIYYRNSSQSNLLSALFPGQVVQFSGEVPQGLGKKLVVIVNGLGVVQPNLDGKQLAVGSKYSMTAKAGPGQMFEGWSGAAVSPSSKLEFVMKPNNVIKANFGPNPFNSVSGVYNGLFSENLTNVQHQSSGLVTFKTTGKGLFTGKLFIGKGYPFHGRFNSTGTANNISVRRGKDTSLSLNLQLDMVNGTDQVQGVVSSSSWTASFVGDRARAIESFAQAGVYTMVIPGDTNATVGPKGNSFGTVKVGRNGDIRLKGTLADGTEINQNVNLSKNGQWPLYVPLYHGKGSILSWVTFTNRETSSFEGNLNWIKTPVPGRNYQGGFTNHSTVLGSSYLVPTNGVRVLDLTNGVVTLSSDNLSSAITNDVTLTDANLITVTSGTNLLKLNVSLPTGLVTGTFVHPETKATSPIKGVVLQQQNTAMGFFISDKQSGSMVLEGN